MNNSPYIHVPTGKLFKDRKEAKMILGQGRFKRLLHKGIISWIKEDGTLALNDIANN